MTTMADLLSIHTTQAQMGSFFIDNMGIYNVKSYDAVGDDSTDDYTALYNTSAAADDNGGIIFFPTGTYKIGTSITFPSNITLWFADGAKLSPDSGITVTINGSIQASLSQVFAGSGTITLSGPIAEVYPQWWGVSIDGDTTTTGSINAGETTLTVASVTTWEIGHGIFVTGAGAAGANLVTSVTAISGTTFTVADAAGTTVSGATVYHDDTVAIQNTITNSYSIIMPYAVFNISSSLDARKSNLTMIGFMSKIVQLTDNTPIIKIGGERILFSGFLLEYLNFQDSTNTNAVGVEFYKLYESIISRLRIRNSYTGIGIKQADYAGSGNYIYSVDINNIRIAEYSKYGLYLKGYNQGISGNILSNIYINNTNSDDLTRRTSTCGLHLETWDNGVLSQINIEHGKLNNAIVFNNCKSTIVNGLHLEELEPVVDYNAFIDLVNSLTNVNINGVTIRYCDILVANVANLYAIGRIADGVVLNLNNVVECDNTVTTPAFNIFYSSTAVTGDIRAINIDYAGITQEKSMPTATPPVVKQINDKLFYVQLGLSGSVVWNPASLADGAGETSAAITITDTALGDYVLVAAPYDLQGIICNGYVSATNTVRIRIQNETGGVIDLASGTWTVRVIKL